MGLRRGFSDKIIFETYLEQRKNSQGYSFKLTTALCFLDLDLLPKYLALQLHLPTGY